MRLIIVSNRLPVSVALSKGKLAFKKSAGGLATGISSYLETLRPSSALGDHLWVGWPGTAEGVDERTVRAELLPQKLVPVTLTDEQVEEFYNGFCNDTIWPLFHYFPSFVSYSQEEWASYRDVNERFCEELMKILRPDDVVWVQDYHLMLLPGMLRDAMPELTIGFFLHIPFPVFEVFRLLPDKWRRQLLTGVMGSDLVGFHTYDYTQYFLDCVQRILGLDHHLGVVPIDGRSVKVDTFPMGIDFLKFYEAPLKTAVEKERQRLRKDAGVRNVILSIDRLDYTKGIFKRLEAYELFLEKHSEWKEKVVLMLVVVPSRTEVERYQEMKRNIDGLVGKINGAFGSSGWTPIVYQFKSLTSTELSALYSISDVALVTPLRDGMNLIAKEYIASRRDKTGVLILSETAGATQELGEAITINPNHINEVADAIATALRMPKEEMQEKNKRMQERLRTYTVHRWAEDFLRDLREFRSGEQAEREHKYAGAYTRAEMGKAFRLAKKKLVVLDYDGTLVPYTSFPPLAKPDKELLILLQQLSRAPGTEVVLMSGRDRQTMGRWFGGLDVSMVAEHGIWIQTQERSAKWKKLKPYRAEWKTAILPIIERFTERLPGSLIEEKEFSIAWHYRTADPLLASRRSKELSHTLTQLTANLDVQVIQGKHVIEVRNAGADKGSATLDFLEQQTYDFILGIGDDTTDEDLFAALPDYAYTIKVGVGQTAAQYLLDSYKDVRAFLEQLGEK